MGLRNALGVALPAALAVDLGYPAYAVVAGMGALNVAAADGTDAYRSRASRMLACTALGAAAIFLGRLTGHDPILSFALAAAWAFGTGMLVALGTSTADIGMLSLVSLFIYIARPSGLREAAWSGVIALGGGLFQTALSILPWPLGRFGPERRAVAEYYAALSRAALLPPDPYGAPLATQQSSLAQEALTAIARDHTVEAERYYLLVSQAERIRITLFSLTRVGERMKREEGGASASAFVRRAVEPASRLLQAVADEFQNQPPAASTARLARRDSKRSRGAGRCGRQRLLPAGFGGARCAVPDRCPRRPVAGRHRPSRKEPLRSERPSPRNERRLCHGRSS